MPTCSTPAAFQREHFHQLAEFNRIAEENVLLGRGLHPLPDALLEHRRAPARVEKHDLLR